MKNSIKRAQSQARLSFAERENFRPKVRQLKKTLLTLVALLALTTQAWATDVYLVGNGTGNWLNGAAWDPGVAGNKMTEQNGVYSITFTNVAANSESPLQFKFAINGSWDMNYGCSSDTEKELNKTLSNIDAFGNNILFRLTETADVTISFNLSELTYMISTKGMKVGDDAASGPEVAWNKTTKTGTFTMPGGNVTLEPEYYPQAALTAAPTAINDVPATTDGAIVNAGTVANIGETETAQGTVMYYVSQTVLDDDALLALLAADAWTADVPTAKSLAQGQAYVYYYVRGNDSDTDEENFSDGDILAANALTVTIAAEPLYNAEFDLTNAPEEDKAPGVWTTDIPEGGVVKGTPVTVTYSGSKKVIGVKAEKSDGSKRLDESTVGMIVCTNGKAYPVNMKDNLPSGVTAVGIVAYKNGKNGLVMALTDEATNMNWGTATGNNGAKAHTPAVEGYSWKVPTLGEWQYNIFTGAGVGNLAGLSTYMTAAGGTGLQNGCYWTSTPKNNSYYACCIKIENGSITFSPGGNTELKDNGYHVRAVFAF